MMILTIFIYLETNEFYFLGQFLKLEHYLAWIFKIETIFL